MTVFLSEIMKGRDFPTAGSFLYDTIQPVIDTEDKVMLDLSEVSGLPSMFLNTSFGRIIKERGVDFVKSKFVFTNIAASDVARLKDYVSRYDAK